jgi:hypothetical protein
MSDVQLQIGWWLLRAMITYLMIREVGVFLLRCVVGRAEQWLQTWLRIPKETIESAEEADTRIVSRSGVGGARCAKGASSETNKTLKRHS